MTIPQIHVTRLGLLVKSTARDFPSLADLAHFLDLKPAGRAPDVAGRLVAVQVIGRAA